ncbi:glycosyltransferase family 9 protein [Acidobacteriota bacterium]
MRRIDQYAGFFLCHMLSILYKVKGKSRVDQPIPDSLSKVLVIKFLGFGSIIMTTPLLAEMKKNYPECEIHFLTFSENVPICESISLIDKTLYLEKSSSWKFVFSLVKNFRLIRKRNYDAVLNLEFFSNFTLILSALSKAGIVLCFGGRHEYSKRLCHRIISYENSTHVTYKFRNFLKIIEIESFQENRPLVRLEESSHAKKKISELLERHRVQTGKDLLIIVNINSSEMSDIRKWPIENYQQIISFLLSKQNVKILLIGGKEDVSYVSQLDKRVLGDKERIINLAGQISLKELISLMKMSYLYIGNDSGPLHLAEACSLPNVSFFGPESPDAYGHPGDKNYIFYSGLPCSPCLNVYKNKDTSCLDNKCLKKIEPAEVIKVLQEKYFS